MRIKKVTLHHFKNFEDFEVNFEDMNFIQGSNGAGKTTIALESFLFAVYGYSTKTIADLATRWIETKSFYVEIEIEHKNHRYTIKRSYPTKLEVKVDGETQKFATSTEATNFLTSLFGDRLYFSKFRIIDAYSKETNFLEEGPATLKKILFTASDELFNNVKLNLNTIKTERERYNKDDVVQFKHYPSDKRLSLISDSLIEISKQYSAIDREISQNEQDLRKDEIKVSENKSKIVYLNKQITDIDTLRSSFDNSLRDKESRILNNATKIENLNKQLEENDKQNKEIVNTNVCYVCKRPLEEHTSRDLIKERVDLKEKISKNILTLENETVRLKEEIVQLKESIIRERAEKLIDFNKNIEALKIEVESISENLSSQTEIIAQDKIVRDEYIAKKEKLNALKIKLEARLKQRAYIYTTKDVLVAKKAIESLDQISSIYLVETVKVLEPIINSILEKIQFVMHFDVDTKGKFNIILEKDNNKYSYKDLSTGQKLLFQIAIKLALLMQKNEEGLVIADEGMGALDSKNLLHVINMFANFPFQLLFVLHNVADLPAFVNIIDLNSGE